MKKEKEEGLVKCPQLSDVHYFLWHCREQKARGVEPCVRCEAMEKPQPLQVVMDQIRD